MPKFLGGAKNKRLVSGSQREYVHTCITLFILKINKWGIRAGIF
jgi:hypothetical protein